MSRDKTALSYNQGTSLIAWKLNVTFHLTATLLTEGHIRLTLRRPKNRHFLLCHCSREGD